MWLPSEEEQEFGGTVARMLRERDTVAHTRRDADDPFAWNQALWLELQQMGLSELIPEGEIGAAIATAEALGNHPATVPVLSSAVLVPALAQHLGFDLDLSRVWAIGSFDTRGRLAPVALTLDAQGRAEGELPRVLNAPWAEVVLIVGRDGVYSIETAQEAVAVRPRASLDPTLPFADLVLSGAHATLVFAAEETAVETAVTRTSDIAALWLSASQIGTAQQLLDLAVAYAGQRVQFGMRIGERQAIKHKCADMLMRVESARSALWAAADLSPEDPRWAASLSLLRLAAGSAVDFTAQQSFQIHGGIGFTWEHDLPFLFKRALVTRQLFGGEEDARSRLLSVLLETP